MKNIMQICLHTYVQTFTLKILLLPLSLLATQLALAQVQDSFADDDFTNNPSWSGDADHFTVQNGRLALNAGNADGVAFLSVSSSLSSHASWECHAELAFNPSSSNYARFYLVSDNAELSTPLNGYFVMAGGTNDDVCLYRQEGKQTYKVIDGKDGKLNTAAPSFRIKVTHDDSGWKLYVALATEQYMLEGSAESPVIAGSYSGVACYFTPTRSDKFYFDDFSIIPYSGIDDQPPALISAEVIDSRSMRVTFTEPMDKTSAEDLKNYQVTGTGSVAIIGASVEGSDVILHFSADLPENVNLQLNVAGLADIAGNPIAPSTTHAIFTKPATAAYRDVVISEVMSDPEPTVGLPAVEYVEIYNRTDQSLPLKGWTISDGSSVASLPDVLLEGRRYLALLSESDFELNFDHIFLKNFPSLNNTGDAIILKDQNGITIDSIRYFASWHRDRQKSGGGWSLEIIDPDNICGESGNWASSEDSSGGTPGRENSVLASKPDLTPPRITAVIPLDPFNIIVRFDEKLDKLVPSPNRFAINRNIVIVSTSFNDPTLTGVKLNLANELQTGQSYSMSVSDIRDCAGNTISETITLDFGLPEAADSLDVLINEVLFNPTPTGYDFVEMINRSSKYFNLKGWHVARFKDDKLDSKTLITAEHFLLAPGEILALTENAEVIKNEYIASVSGNFLQVVSLPTLPDDRASVGITDSSGNVIDLFHYDKSMHSTFLKDDEGVSLERISLSGDGDQWKSGTSSTGYATPGYRNANLFETELSSEIITIDPAAFNPLSSPSFARINYAFDQGGYIATVRIFDSYGRVVKHIANNALLGATGYFRWDGDRDDGRKANVGYYMVAFEIFDDRGTVRRYRNAVAVAATF